MVAKLHFVAVVRAGGELALAIGSHFVYTYIMGKSTVSVHKKKIGRPATGHDPAVTVRIPAGVLEAVGKWAERNGYSRSSAIALLVDLGLATVGTKRGSSLFEAMFGTKPKPD
jgi:hypothetical protein